MGTVYILINNYNDKIYVGQTTQSFDNRIKQHYIRVDNGSTTHFHNALRKWGPEAFSTVLIDCPDSYLHCIEQFLIDEFDSIKNGYNLKDGGQGGKHSESSKNKISKALVGHGVSQETKNKISNKLKDRKFSEETINKMSASAKGRKHSEESKVKIGIASKERTKSEVTKKKISKALKGRKFSEESINKMSKSKTGKNNVASKPIELILPNGKTKVFYSLGEAARAYDLDSSGLSKVARDKLKHYKGFRCKFL